MIDSRDRVVLVSSDHKQSQPTASLPSILGERYGYVPQGIDQQARSQYGWLQRYTDKAYRFSPSILTPTWSRPA